MNGEKMKTYSSLGSRILIFACIIGIIYFIASPLLIIRNEKLQVFRTVNDIPHYRVAIVFGAGVNSDNKPSDALAHRLITVAELYKAGKIEEIIVTGDNRFENYNEPEAMARYLIEKQDIPKTKIHLDYAGRRTYDSCIRAKKLWNVNKAILVTQGFHLYRAIYTCNYLGIESTGISATRSGYVGQEVTEIREFFALHKSIIDTHLLPPEYVSGKVEGDLSDVN